MASRSGATVNFDALKIHPENSWSSAGVPDTRVLGHCDGVCDGRGHVPAGGAAAGPVGEGRALVLSAAYRGRRLLSPHGALPPAKNCPQVLNTEIKVKNWGLLDKDAR